MERHRVHQEEVDSLAAERLPYVCCVPCCVLIPHLYGPSVTLLNRGLQHGNENCRPVPTLIMEFRDGWHRLNHNGIKKGRQHRLKTRRGVGGGADKGWQREQKGWWSSEKDLFTKSHPAWCAVTRCFCAPDGQMEAVIRRGTDDIMHLDAQNKTAVISERQM